MENPEYQPLPTPKSDRPPARPRFALWFLVFPLLACLACSALTIYSLVPLRSKFFERFAEQPVPVIPLTGDDAGSEDSSNPKSSPGPSGSAAPSEKATPSAPDDRGIPKASPSYRSTLDRTIASCTDSFHKFLMVQQAGFSDPGLFDDVTWRNSALDASTSFNTDCKQFESLPEAPNAYTEVDYWLKKAAGEVNPATDDFNTMLSMSGGFDASKARSALRHMVRFIQYTQQAENVLSGLNDLKQL